MSFAEKNENTKTKKHPVGKAIILLVAWIVFGLIFMKCYNVNQLNRTTLVRQFGKITNVVTEPGVYFTNPLQNTVSIYTGERLYDIPVTNVTTSDKKSMTADAFVTWQITDVPQYYRELSSAEAAAGRISSSVYSSLKKVISATLQEEVIAGKDGSLSTAILDNADDTLDKYGIKLVAFDIKGLDLPDDNEAAVYDRMISERAAIEAQYHANGDKIYNTAVAKTDAEVRTLKSNAEAEAAQILADAEKEYYTILKKSYSSSREKEEFYNYYLGLMTLKESLKNGGTYQITPDSPLYNILINSSEK